MLEGVDKAKGWFDKIVDAKPGNRVWVLSVVINFLLGAALITTYFVFSTRESTAIQDKIKAETKLSQQMQINLNDNKACLELVRSAEKAKDLEWSIKFDAIQNTYIKEQKERAERSEKTLELLRQRAIRNEKRTTEIIKQVKQ